MACNFDEQALIDGRKRSAATAQGLGDVARLLESSDHVEGIWPQLAARIATLLNAETCWIVFAGAGNDSDSAVRAYKNDGTIQVQKSAGDDSGLHPMLARASAMLVLQSHASPRAHDHDAGGSAIFMPIRVDDTVLGVLHVQGSTRNLPFNEMHVETSQVVAFLIGKALHLGRLQKILNSRFAQLALIRQPGSGTAALRQALRDPKATATLMAKAFYKEMARAGFTPPEIIAAASEIISELTNTLKSRSKDR